MKNYLQKIASFKNCDSYTACKMFDVYIEALLDKKLTNKEKDQIQAFYIEKAISLWLAKKQ